MRLVGDRFGLVLFFFWFGLDMFICEGNRDNGERERKKNVGWHGLIGIWSMVSSYMGLVE